MQLEGQEECRKLPNWGLRRSLNRNRIWCILVLKIIYLVAKILVIFHWGNFSKVLSCIYAII